MYLPEGDFHYCLEYWKYSITNNANFLLVLRDIFCLKWYHFTPRITNRRNKLFAWDNTYTCTCVKRVFVVHVCLLFNRINKIKISTVAWGLNYFHPGRDEFEMFSNILRKQNKWEHLGSWWTVVCVGWGESKGRKPAIDQLTIRCHLCCWKCWQGGKLDTGRNWAANKPCVKPWNKKL